MGAKLAMWENRKAPVPVLGGNFFLTPCRFKASKPKCEWYRYNWNHLISRGNGRGKRSCHWGTDYSSWLCTSGEWRSNSSLSVLNFRHTHVSWTLYDPEISAYPHKIPLGNTGSISTLLWGISDERARGSFVERCKYVSYPPFLSHSDITDKIVFVIFRWFQLLTETQTRQNLACGLSWRVFTQVWWHLQIFYHRRACNRTIPPFSSRFFQT